jgi:sulfate permease, SulP family
MAGETTSAHRAVPRLALLTGLLPFSRKTLAGDVLAGITLAALGIPEVMGYTRIAGTPVVTGLYTLLLPAIAFALIGGSRHLVVAADSATAAILAAMLATAATFGSPAYVGLTSLTALAVGAMLVLARVFRLGFLADFLSRSALIGFLSGVGIQVAASATAGLFGLADQGHGPIGQIISVAQRLADARGTTLAIALAVLAVIIGCKRFAPLVPGALIAVIGAIAASAWFDLAAHGVAVVGAVPRGLPALSLPRLAMADLTQVLACAGSCFVVIVAQSAATARAYALRYEEGDSENADLLGLAAANVAAALTGTFVVNGSPTKTEMVDEAGGRSQLAQLVTAGTVLLVLLLLTRPLGYLPNAVLSAIVFMIGIKLIDVAGMRDLFRLQRNEFFIASVTALTVVLFTVMDGIAVAVVLSLVEQVRHSYQPRTRVLIADGDGLVSVAPAPDHFAAPGIIAYRFEANLFYANAGMFATEVLRLVADATALVTAVVLDGSGIDDIDYSAGKMLIKVKQELARRNVVIVAVAIARPFINGLQRYGFGDGEQAPVIYPTVPAAIAALRGGGAG